MGIKGLHAAIKHLKSYIHVSETGLKTVAVDASSFMMKGGIKYAREYFIKTLTGKPWADYCLDIALTLQENGITPIFVFDGRRLPIKDDTSEIRRATKAAAYTEAQLLEEAYDIEKARCKWQQAFELDDDTMTDDVIGMLFMNNIEWKISAWEADQTMAAMYKSGDVDGVVTEDSDMVAYGVEHIVFKLRLDGQCEYLKTSTIRSEDPPPAKKSRRIDVSLDSLNIEQRAQLCTLAGNDYNHNVMGVGIKKVYSMISQYSWNVCLATLNVSKDYVEHVTKTLYVFLNPEKFTSKSNENPFDDTVCENTMCTFVV